MKKIKLLTLLTLILFSVTGMAGTYHSLVSGNWSDVTIWDNGIPDDSKENTIIISSGTIVTADNLDFRKSTEIIVEENAELIINTLDVNIDAVETNKDFMLTVKDNGKLTIIGNMTSAKDGLFVIDGDVTIDGNMTLGNNTTLIVDEYNESGGTLTVTGDLTAGNGSILLGEGPVTVGGSVVGIEDGLSDQLPIELLYFKGYYRHDMVILSWMTASESNNDYYRLEYSYNGEDWLILGHINGAGNSSTTLRYEYNHKTEMSAYYRLTQFDYNGDYEVFDIIYIDSPHIDENGYYRVYDIHGRVLMEDHFQEILNMIRPNTVYFLGNNNRIKKIIVHGN